MRILLFSDIHSDEYAFESLKSIYADGNFDYVFVTGDIIKGSISFVDKLLAAFPDCFALPGNCDEQYVIDKLEQSNNFIHRRRVEIAEGYNVVGFGFSLPTPFHTYGEMSEEEIKEQVSELQIDNKTLLLTHTPPKGLFDDVNGNHVGSSAIRKIIEEKKPFANFCGHVHEYAGVDKINNTIIVKIPAANNWRYAVANTKDKKLSVEFFQM